MRGASILALALALAGVAAAQTVGTQPRGPARRAAVAAAVRAGAGLGLHGVALSWSPSPTVGVTYTVERGTASGGPYATIAAGLPGTYYLDPSPPAGTYYYVVVAVLAGVQSAASNEASATVP